MSLIIIGLKDNFDLRCSGPLLTVIALNKYCGVDFTSELSNKISAYFEKFQVDEAKVGVLFEKDEYSLPSCEHMRVRKM